MPTWSMTMIRPLSITVLRRWAIVITVQSMNASLNKNIFPKKRQKPNRLLDESIRIQINSSSRFVQNQNLSLPQQRPKNKTFSINPMQACKHKRTDSSTTYFLAYFDPPGETDQLALPHAQVLAALCNLSHWSSSTLLSQ